MAISERSGEFRDAEGVTGGGQHSAELSALPQKVQAIWIYKKGGAIPSGSFTSRQRSP